MEELQQNIEPVIPPRRPWRFASIGCAVFLVFVLIALIGFLLVAYRNPYYRGMAECTIQMREVGAAVERYGIKNDGYPEKLEKLVPDYIQAKWLHCPSDKSDAAVSYTYHRVSSNAPDDTVILECTHHKSKRASMPITYPRYLKSGKITFYVTDPAAKKP